jgi:hypothetical protein
MLISEETIFYSQENFLVVARRMFDAGLLRELRRRIDSRIGASRAGDERSRIALSAGVAPDEVRLSKDWYEIWKTARVESLMTLVPQFSQVIFPPQIRTVRGAATLVPWHQDAAYMKALGSRGHRSVITCFLPLEESTVGKPLIEFHLRPDQTLAEHVIREDAQINKFDLPEGAKPARESCTRFDLTLGDVFVFGQHVLHRTYAVDDPAQSRTSMEFRITTRECVVQGKDYYDIERGSWYVA